VLLQVVAFAGDVADDFKAIRQANFRHFTKCRVRFFGGSGVNAGANAFCG
jgi:hypothetical protein